MPGELKWYKIAAYTRPFHVETWPLYAGHGGVAFCDLGGQRYSALSMCGCLLIQCQTWKHIGHCIMVSFYSSSTELLEPRGSCIRHAGSACIYNHGGLHSPTEMQWHLIIDLGYGSQILVSIRPSATTCCSPTVFLEWCTIVRSLH